MMELHKAYEIIGVQPDCTVEELDLRYDYLLRVESRQAHLDQINEAYRIIYNHLLKPDDQAKKSFRKKVDNFFYHYKNLVIFGGLTLILVISLLYTLVDSQIEKRKEANLPPPSLEIMIFGDYVDEDLSLLNQRIIDLFPAWESVKSEIIYAPSEADSQMDMAALQKSVVIMATETPDIYILDKNHYEKFIDQAPFLALDQLDEKLPNDHVLKAHLKYFQREEDDREHLYGIDLINNDLFQGLAMENENKIAVILADTMNEDNALDFLLKIID